MTRTAETPSQLERIFVVAALLLMLGALKGLFSDLTQVEGGMGSSTSGNLRFQLASMTVYMVSLAFIVRRLDHFFWLCLRNKALLVLLAMVMVSALWSTDPVVTLRRGSALLGTSFFAIYLVMRFRPDELMRLLTYAFLAAALASLFAVFLVPSVGLHVGDAHSGLWRGVFGHKNMFGRMMALGAILLLLMTQSRSFPPLLAWGGFLLCALLTAMSQSMTAWVGFMASLPLIVTFRILRDTDDLRAMQYGFLLAFIAAISLYLLFSYMDVFLGLLGRDGSLSARTKIWDLAFEAGARQPIFGYGYRVFWTQDNAAWFYGLLSWSAGFGHSHNAFIDMWLDLGFVGLGVFALVVVIMIRRILAHRHFYDPVSALWHPVSILFILITGITEQSLLQQGTIEWVLFVAIAFYVSIPQKTPRAAQDIAQPSTVLVK
jgi:O-antigen ligase